MTRRRYTHLTVISLATSALLGCRDDTPPTTAVPPTTPLTELAGVDTTPPVITYTLSGTLGPDNWYTDSVALEWTVTDPESPVDTSAGTCSGVVMKDWGQSRHECTASSAGGISSDTATFKIDNLGPRPLPPLFFRTAQSAAGWWNTDVTVVWNCYELEFESAAVDPLPTAIVSTEGRNQVFVGTCVDKAGNVNTTEYADFDGVPISIDKTPPALAPTVSANPVVLGRAATVLPNATDALSGVASQSCGPVVTSSPGTKSVSCTATDSANNTVTTSVAYTVLYAFTGFAGLNAPPALNAARAGRSIAVKFGLAGDEGLTVLAAESPTSQAISCVTMTKTSTSINTPTAGSLTYSSKTDTYTYDWRTDQAWVGTCRQLTVQLADGTQHKANFRFK